MTDPLHVGGQHVDAVPAAKRPGKTNHAIALGEAETFANLPFVLRRRRRIRRRVRAVRVDEDLARIDFARD